MTKEQLKKEAEMYLAKLLKRLKIKKENLAENQPEFLNWEEMNFVSLNVSNVSKAYIAGAEPREKRIAELEAQIEKMKFEAVKEAFRQGKVIQYNLEGEWVDWSEPTFDDEPCNYRIKEE